MFTNRNPNDETDPSLITLEEMERRNVPPTVPAMSYVTPTNDTRDEIAAQRNYGAETMRRQQQRGCMESFTNVSYNNGSNTVGHNSTSIREGIYAAPPDEMQSQARFGRFDDTNYAVHPYYLSMTSNDQRPTFNVDGNHAQLPLGVNTEHSSNMYAPATYSNLQQEVNLVKRPLYNQLPNELSVSMYSETMPSQSQGAFQQFRCSYSNGADSVQAMNPQMPNRESGFVRRPAVVSKEYMTQQTPTINNLLPIRQASVQQRASCSQNPEPHNQVVSQNPDHSSNFGMGVDPTAPRNGDHQTGDPPIQGRQRRGSMMKYIQGNQHLARPLKCDNEDEDIVCLDSDASTDGEDEMYSDSSTDGEDEMYSDASTDGEDEMYSFASTDGEDEMYSDASTDSEDKMYSGSPSFIDQRPNTKSNMIRDQLLHYLHASSCKRKLDVGAGRECSVPYCNSMRNLLTHMETCHEDESCKYIHCSSMKVMKYHWEKCPGTGCYICPSVGKRARKVMQADDVPHLIPRSIGTKRNSAGQTMLSSGGFNRWHASEPKKAVPSAAVGASTSTVTVLDCKPSTSNTDVQSSGICMKEEETSFETERSSKLAELPDGILDDVWKAMECNTCLDIPVPPVFMCSKGHQVCQSCKARITKCPLCKKPIMETRIRVLESVIETMPLPCPNREHGCRDIFYLADRNNHVLFCRYKP